MALSLCLTSALLSGCVSSGDKVPDDFRSCFNYIVPKPQHKTMTEAELLRLIGELRKSEVAKSRCGKLLIQWADERVG